MIRRPPRSTQSRSSAASDVYKRQGPGTAVLLGNVGCVEVGRQQRLGRLAGVARLLVDHGGVRRDLRVADRTDRLADGLMLLGQREQRELAHGPDPTAG